MQAKESNIVKRTLDLDNPPKPTKQQQQRLAAVAAMPDVDIDYQDAPFKADAVWKKAVLPTGVKKQITLRLDTDVLAFFRSTGKNYQTRINAVLRSYMDAYNIKS